jgi:hypothetical protein
MWPLLLTLLVAKSARCAVDVQPRISMAPARYLRVKASIEPDDANRGARLVLVDEGGELTSSLIQLDAKTHWIEWKNILLGPGEYEVVLIVVDSTDHQTCQARAHVEVSDGDETNRGDNQPRAAEVPQGRSRLDTVPVQHPR